MATLTTRIEKLKNRTSDVQVRQLCESILELTDHVPERNLSVLMRDRLKSLDSQDAHAQRFMVNEKRLARLGDMGISRALERIKMTGVWTHNPRIQYILEWYGKHEINRTPDFLLADQFIDQMSPFCYDPTINEAIDVVRNLRKTLEEDIAVAKTIHVLENSRSAKFYTPLINNLRDYLENKSAATRSVIISESETYAYETVVKELQNALKTFESRENKHKLHITGGTSDCTIEPVYSFVLVERNADYFSVSGNYFKKVGNELTPISVEAMSRINEQFVTINSILLEDNVSVGMNKVSYSYGNNKIDIATDTKAITYNGKPLNINEINEKLLEAGIFRYEQRDDLNKVNNIYKNISTLCEIDFAKTISSKSHKGVSATILKLDESVTLIKKNPYMNENKVYSNMNGTQARNTILEFLGYDISESLVEFLSVENKKLQTIENERRDILNKISDCETGINKINEAQQDIHLLNSEELTAVKRELGFEINRLKDLYAKKTQELNAIKTFEDKGFDPYMEPSDDAFKSSKKGKGAVSYVQMAPERDFSIGDEVDVADKGIGRITGIDSAQKVATVMFSDGSQSDVEFPEMRKASDNEVDVEDDYQDELTSYADLKKKGTTSYIQQTPTRDYSVGEVVMVLGKGLGKITAIDAVRHVAIVFLQNGQQTEEEFSNLQSQEAELDNQMDMNSAIGDQSDIDYGGVDQDEQPFESETTILDVDDDVIVEIDDDVDSTVEDPEMMNQDMERANAFSTVGDGYKKYMDEDEPYKYNPDDVPGQNMEIEYAPETSNPDKFMHQDDEYQLTSDEVRAKEIPDLASMGEETPYKQLKYTVSSQDAAHVAEDDEDYIINSDEAVVPEEELQFESNGMKVKAVVSPAFEGDLADKDIMVDFKAYESASSDDILEVEYNGLLDFVPKSSITIVKDF